MRPVTSELKTLPQNTGGHGADVDVLGVVDFACERRSSYRKSIVIDADGVGADFTRSKLGRERVASTARYFDGQTSGRTCRHTNNTLAQCGPKTES